MNRKIRVGAVSYLNTKPLVYGFEQGMMADEMELSFEYPAALADKLVNDEIDLGLVPVAILPKLREYYLVSDYGISCDGEVASVCLFSDVPLHEIKTILLDYQSRTSVALLRILLKEYWEIAPELVAAQPGYEEQIKGTTAGLVIGDRAFAQRLRSAYSYDLGAGWKAHTGQPFVFATWVSNKVLPSPFLAAFNEASAYGLNNLGAVLAQHTTPNYDLEKYYTQDIKFRLEFDKLAVITLFLDKLRNS